jgi:hypothetical protein
MTGCGEPSYATLRLQYTSGEQTEGFADIAQAAAWTLAHLHDATWEAVIPAGHATFDEVLAQLEGDDGARARFLARCGESDEGILTQLSNTDVDLRAVLVHARDELAVMAEHDER